MDGVLIGDALKEAEKCHGKLERGEREGQWILMQNIGEEAGEE